VYAPETAKLSISARVFGDSFPEPFTLKASVSLEVKQKEMALAEVIPEWEKLLDKNE